MRLAELAAASGIEQEAFRAWATAPCPEGMDPRMWADAQSTRVQHARPWHSAPLDRLPRYMSGVLPQAEPEQHTESAADAA